MAPKRPAASAAQNQKRRLQRLALIAALCAVAFAAALCCLSLAARREPVAFVLLTDRPEFALYAEEFNAAQDEYKAEVRYAASPARELAFGAQADIAAASYLTTASARRLFRPRRLSPEEAEAFYPGLLAGGNIRGRQRLLPVSFNIPAVVFSRNYQEPFSSPSTIGLDEIREKAAAYNARTGGVHTRMGFSPAWSDSALLLTAVLRGVSFREAAARRRAPPLAWDEAALEETIAFLRNWTEEVNGGVLAEDGFTFKYFTAAPLFLARSGRVLFAFESSAGFLTLPAELRSGLDFRWAAQADGLIPLEERSVYLGVLKRAKARKASGAFVNWLFREETQRTLLETVSRYGLGQKVFGIAGGFSSLRAVTEQTFPRFYPALLGHLPAALSPPAPLPYNWASIKEEAVLPYLRERYRGSNSEDIRSLERRMINLRD
ncbi:MAG: lipoprotein/extracellular solute-binding protein [Treponematales bacterium]